MIGDILSQSFSDVQVYRDVAYEWEEDAAKHFSVPIRKIIIPAVTYTHRNILKAALIKAFPALRGIKHRIKMKLFPSPVHDIVQDIHSPMSLCFLMFPHEISICLENNCLPVFLDVWRKTGGIDFVANKTRKLDLFYVTSRDVYDEILEKNPDSRVKYIPLAVSDRYYSKGFEKYRDKFIDVVQFGRANSVLHEYMLRYVSEHREVEYVYSGTGRSAGEYISTSRGKLGAILGRKDFMRMLAGAKVSLVSSPGSENSKDYAEGIDFVTPRFYESAALGCALIGRYPDNEEFQELNMSRYCTNITSYEQFCECLEHALAQSPEELYAQNHDFIINSLTSRRAEQIQHDLESLS